MGVTAVGAAVARLHRAVLDLPNKTPWRFIFGAEHLAMAHPAVSLWITFPLKLTIAANSAHGQTGRAVRWEVVRHVQATHTQPQSPVTHSEYDILGRWCAQVGWSVRVVRDESHGERWTYDGRPLLARQPLLLVGDFSAHASQHEWGMGAILAALQGDVLWEARAWMHVQGASTTLLEATILHEAARAVLETTEGREAWPTL